MHSGDLRLCPERNTRKGDLLWPIGCALTLGGLGNKAAWPAGASSNPLASGEGNKKVDDELTGKQ